MQDCKCHNCSQIYPVPDGKYQGLCPNCDTRSKDKPDNNESPQFKND